VKHRLLVCGVLGLLAACGPKKIATIDPAIAARETLAKADANLRAGCFDCLVEALEQYKSVRTVSAVSSAAAAGALRASLLLAIRERELGTTDSGYLEDARPLAAAVPEMQADVAAIFDVVAAWPWRVGSGRSSASPDSLVTNFFRDRDGRTAAFRASATRDELSAYVFIGYACESGSGLGIGNAEMRNAVGAMIDAPLVAYRLSICPTSGLAALDEVVAREPRFKEAAFYKGLRAVGGQKLDEADARYRDAYAWRKTWPAATLAIANVSMSAEEFQASREFYDETLTLAPDFPDALLGKVRALTYLSRPEDAMAVADRLLAIQRYPGDAYYWKAYNELQLERLEPAWADVEAADRLLINSDVPKLAGIIAIDRKQYDVARTRLEVSRQRNPMDCTTLYYLTLVQAELRLWTDAARGAVSAAGCLSAAEVGLRAEIERIRTDEKLPELRKARMITGRQQQIMNAIRMRASCWFNGGIANLNLSKKAEAKELLEKIADDEQFGERVRQLLALTRP
jgi:tetratricopeptide (TPR) repeat protein